MQQQHVPGSRPSTIVGARPSNDFGRNWPLHHRFVADDGLDDPLGCAGRPSWRGRVHLLGLWVAVPAMVLLVLTADGTRAVVGASIYAMGLCSMLAASTTYHRWVHQMRHRAAWRRADHALIFAAIAGSATPIILVAMPSGWGVALLVVVWTAAGIGASMKFGPWRHGDTVGTAMYALTSALAALALPALWIHGGAVSAVLYVVSGLLYILGAHWFARTWPRLNSAVFSYHEVWHSCTVAAAAMHFLVVWRTVA